MSVFRISRHLIRGQFASAACFEAWLVANTDAGRVQLITVREEPGIPPGGPSDARYYIWRQDAQQVPAPVGCSYDLVKVGTQIEWPSAEAALAVVEGKVQAAAKVDANVKAANAKAVSAGNIAAGIASDAVGAAGDVADALSPTAKVVLTVAGFVGGGWVLYRLATSGRR